MNTEKPFAPACERNQQVIFEVLAQHLSSNCKVLEVGSGTGQHAIYFQSLRTDWQWQCSDIPENLPGIALWLESAPQLKAAIEWDVLADTGPHTAPTPDYDAVFTANSLHIMPWIAVEHLFAKLAAVLKPGGHFIAYGPFNYGGRFTSDSNAQFDVSLKSRASHQGIRDFEAVNRLAELIDLELIADVAMPANNRTLVWKRPG